MIYLEAIQDMIKDYAWPLILAATVVFSILFNKIRFAIRERDFRIAREQALKESKESQKALYELLVIVNGNIKAFREMNNNKRRLMYFIIIYKEMIRLCELRHDNVQYAKDWILERKNLQELIKTHLDYNVETTYGEWITRLKTDLIPMRSDGIDGEIERLKRYRLIFQALIEAEKQ